MFKKWDEEAWTELLWLMGGKLVLREMRGIAYVAQELSVSQ